MQQQSTECKPHYGKYRGSVKNNLDPQGLGRIQVQVPAVLGDVTLAWAMPCSPYAGPGVGFFAIPPVGAQVWVEFEGGDPELAIWSGCFWGVGDVPALPPGPTQVGTKMLKTDAVSVSIVDLPGIGGVTIEVGPPAVPAPVTFTIDAQGVSLVLGKSSIKLTPFNVSINDGALEVL